MDHQSQRAFREYAHLVTPEVGPYLRRRMYPLPESDLDDLVAEVLLISWKRFDSVPEGYAVAWSIGVARNVLRNAKRASSRRSTHEGELRPFSPTPSAEEITVASDAVSCALRSLPDEAREVLLLSAWDGLSVADIALVLGVSANAAAVRLSRAKALFTSNLDADEKLSLSIGHN
jgi:RNA polymerase sigma-70 factor (ECF subfamily)